MNQILGLKFRDHGQIYYFSSGAFVVKTGDRVLVKTEQGLGLGVVAMTRDDMPPGVDPGEVKPIYRLANDEDVEAHRENEQLGAEAFRYCRDRIRERELEMKLVDVEVFHDRGKMVFYFTAPGRIDFRELVKDLVKSYHTRIELRQIGVRHESQMLGAIGNCGQVCCCRRFMRRFAPVTIKMAKEQNLFLNPTKISGICGRLLCCLNFEQENYEQFQKKCPKIGKRISTSMGPVKILRTNIFRETISFFTEGGEEHEVTVDEWREILSRPPQRESRPEGQQEGRPPRPERPERSDRPDRSDRPRDQRPPRDGRDGRDGRDATETAESGGPGGSGGSGGEDQRGQKHRRPSGKKRFPPKSGDRQQKKPRPPRPPKE